MSKNKYESTEEGYLLLARAIIVQAADDYRAACKAYKRYADIKAQVEKGAKYYPAADLYQKRLEVVGAQLEGARSSMEALERGFFFNPWGRFLGQGANMEYITNKIRKEYGINDIQRH